SARWAAFPSARCPRRGLPGPARGRRCRLRTWKSPEWIVRVRLWEIYVLRPSPREPWTGQADYCSDVGRGIGGRRAWERPVQPGEMGRAHVRRARPRAGVLGLRPRPTRRPTPAPAAARAARDAPDTKALAPG